MINMFYIKKEKYMRKKEKAMCYLKLIYIMEIITMRVNIVS